jgi:hypothetical protein
VLDSAYHPTDHHDSLIDSNTCMCLQLTTNAHNAHD